MCSLGTVLNTAMDLYVWVIIAGAIMSWLVSFGTVNLNHPLAAQVWKVIRQLTDPVYKQVHKILPPMGGIDFSPIIVLFLVFFLQSLVRNNLMYNCPFSHQ